MTDQAMLEFIELAMLANHLAGMVEKHRDWHVKELARRIKAGADRLRVPEITLKDAINGRPEWKQ